MKVFISWSGERSRQLAFLLRDWLPNVLQAVEPWLSSQDIPLGSRWASEISDALAASDIGIVCLTSDNVNSAWLNFEAGAISKLFSNAKVCIYALDVSPAEIQGPLSLFQASTATRDDTFGVVRSLNESLGNHALTDNLLQRSFDRWWPELEHHLIQLASVERHSTGPQISLEDKIDEVLAALKQLSRARDVEEVTPSQPVQTAKPISQRPRVFIGSSSEGLPVAEVIQVGLDRVAECMLWNQSTFGLASTNIESIVDTARTFDFAVLVLTPDDVTQMRGQELKTPRDNLVFELGLFTGLLGRARTFMVYPRDSEVHLPSDLSGVTAATYASRLDGNLEAALGPVCTRIKRAMGVA